MQFLTKPNLNVGVPLVRQKLLVCISGTKSSVLFPAKLVKLI